MNDRSFISSQKVRIDTQKFLPTQVCLPVWEGNAFLEPEYTRILSAIVTHEHSQPYTVILHGSVLWGDRTNLQTGLPVSDVDVLVVGDNLSELSAAVVTLKSIAKATIRSSVPMFKLSAKFRTRAEIVSAISANELGALLHGRVLAGPNCFDVLCPNELWFYDQANLAIATRLVYVAEQRKKIKSSKYEGALLRYLAARLILEIATVGLLAKGFVGLSYRNRVASFLNRYDQRVPTNVRRELRNVLFDALYTKKDPDAHQFMGISDASKLLVEYCRMLGLGNFTLVEPEDFWRTLRPLDIRDRSLWEMSLGSIS